MKTYKGLWEQLISEENFREAEKKAIRGKSGQRGVRMYMKDPDGKRERLRQQLIAGEYRTGDYVAKLVWEPKERTIYKLRFYPDRLLHHAVMNVLRPILEEKFIQNSYACQTGKGPLAASLKCSEMIRKSRYCLQCDIRKFYPSINQAILSRQMHRIIADKRFMAVLDDIIFSFPGETNIPIGNYTSQWLANYYMTGLDNYILHRLKPKGYIRYNDDFLLFDNDKAKLNRCREEIRDYLQRELALEYSKAELFDVKQGVDFCGYRHFGKYVLIRKSTANRMKRRYREIRKKMASGDYDLDRIEGQVAAGNGLMSHACSGHLRKAIRHEEIWERVQKEKKEREQEHENAGICGRDGAAGGGQQQRAADPGGGGELRSGGHAEGVLHPGEHDDDPAGGAGIPRSDPGEH